MAKGKQSPEFSEAVTKLTLKDIFFTALLYDLKVIPQDDFRAVAATDGVHLYYNPELFKKYSRDHRVFILAHEIMHVVLFHPLRRGIRNPEIWNIAADLVVNLMLSEHGFKNVPEDGLFDVNVKDMTTEQVYDMLIRSGKVIKLPKEFADVMNYDPANNGGKTAKEVEKLIGISTGKAAEAAKIAGSGSELIKRFLSDVIVTKQPWYKILSQYMSAYTAKQFNWARPDFRRSQTYGMLIPKMQSESMGKAVISIDVSGSMTADQLSAIGSHMTDMMNECRPSAVVLCYFDSRVVKTVELDDPHYDIKLEMVGGGGTDFTPPVEFAESVTDAQVHIIFTDMCGPMPDSSLLDTLWVTNYAQAAMFGDVIEADFND